MGDDTMSSSDPAPLSTPMPSLSNQPTLDNSVWYGNALVSLLVSAEATGGRYALIYMRNQRGFTPPPHRHGPEACYVIRGRLWFDIAGEEIIATEGHLVNVPPSVWHAFRVESDEAEYLLTFSPPGMEQLFFRAGKPAGALEPPAGRAGPPDLAQIQAIASALGIETAPPGSSVRDLGQAR